jgi:hypothetical protein
LIAWLTKLKVFFTVLGKHPSQATSADVFFFLKAQRAAAG